MKNELDDFLSNGNEERPIEGTPEPKKRYGLFDYINDMSEGKTLLAFKVEKEELKFPSDVIPYMINKAFGNFQDTIFFANEMNMKNVPASALYLFYTHGIPKKRRFSKWYKPDGSKEQDIKNLMKYFSWGKNEAMENIKLFSDRQLNEISEELDENDTVKSKTKKKK